MPREFMLSPTESECVRERETSVYVMLFILLHEILLDFLSFYFISVEIRFV